MLKIQGGTVYDPANKIDGEVRDLWIDGGKIVEAPADPGVKPSRIIDAAGLVVMPGGIDMHCHIAGPKVNVARKMRPEEKRVLYSLGKHGKLVRADVNHLINKRRVQRYREARRLQREERALRN